jgi:hypothetical protein
LNWENFYSFLEWSYSSQDLISDGDMNSGIPCYHSSTSLNHSLNLYRNVPFLLRRDLDEPGIQCTPRRTSKKHVIGNISMDVGG